MSRQEHSLTADGKINRHNFGKYFKEESNKVKYVDTVNPTKYVHMSIKRCVQECSQHHCSYSPIRNKKANVHQPQNGYLNYGLFIMTEYHTAMK